MWFPPLSQTERSARPVLAGKFRVKKPQKLDRFSKLNRCPSNLTGQIDIQWNSTSFHPKVLSKSWAESWNPVIRVTRGTVGADLVLCPRLVQFVCEDSEQVFVRLEVKVPVSERLQPSWDPRNRWQQPGKASLTLLSVTDGQLLMSKAPFCSVGAPYCYIAVRCNLLR